MNVELRNVTKRFGDLVAVNDVSLEIEDGEFITLVGPSGCGKTTTLRCIAGLETPTEGQILFDGEDMTYASPKERNIAFVFQNYALYPHMTARRNMSFALEDAGYTTEEIDALIEETAEMLGIRQHLDKTPGELSGGQQQRVALGRSIVRDPDLFLLDEPLSNLDAKLRVHMRAELQKIHDNLGQTMVYVTHDQEEAMTMSDRIAIMNDGKIQQVSPPEQAYHQPVNRFVAGFIGSPAMNFFECTETDGKLDTGSLATEVPEGISGSIAELGVRPEDLTIDPKTGGAPARVNVFEQLGSFNIVYLNVENHQNEVVAQVPPSRYVSPGDDVRVDIVEDRFHLFAEDGTAIYNPPLPSDRTSREFTVGRGQEAD